MHGKGGGGIIRPSKGALQKPSIELNHRMVLLPPRKKSLWENLRGQQGSRKQEGTKAGVGSRER